MRSTIGLFPPGKALADTFLGWQYREADREAVARRQSNTVEALAGQASSPTSDLRDRAETWLKVIKFQQSYTSGWSGSLKLPIGLEGGVNRAVTLAQNQLSLPEVVQFLARFIDDVSLKYQVIIGIDEMDKLASDSLAQRFLNDIKSIFGLERCFYLISVSENAMSNFERRGLPFRDVFDSSFDDFVYVDYLDFSSAQELLEQRVVGRPIPFFGMSYCMSGGLPRDLIRNFRSVLEAYEQAPTKNTLGAICGRVVSFDLRAKVRATRTSAKKIHLEPDVDRFLEILYDLEPGIDHNSLLIESGARLLDMSRSLLPATAAPAPPPSTAITKQEQERSLMAAQLADLAEELGTYVYYAVTLRQFFNDDMKEEMFTHPPMSGTLDTLAKARQVLGVNPGITRTMLKSFRAAHVLAVLPN